MSESAKEKMLAGEPFLAGDPELGINVSRVRGLQKQFNDMHHDDPARMDVLRQMIGKCPDEFWVEAPIYVDHGSYIEVGERTFINSNCHILDANWIKIGKEVLIATNVQILSSGHPVKASERCVYPYPDEPDRMNFVNIAKPVTIGDNCWIGAGAIIMPGVTIGDRTTIGAGSVVTKDIPSDCVAVGNPARVIKEL